MATLADLIAWRDALQEARFSGLRRVEYAGRVHEYKTDAEHAAAIAALDRQINEAGATRVSIIRINSSKGF